MNRLLCRPADRGLLARFRRELCPNDKGAVLEIGNTFAFEGLQRIGGKLRVRRNFLTDLIEQLEYQFGGEHGSCRRDERR